MDNAMFHKLKKDQRINRVCRRQNNILAAILTISQIRQRNSGMKRWIKEKIEHYDEIYQAISKFFIAQITT